MSDSEDISEEELYDQWKASLPPPKKDKIRSPTQKVVQQLGMDLFATGSTSQLVKFFRENKMPNAASQLEQMVVDARVLARVKYENARRELDPSWKSVSELENEKWLSQR